MTRVCHLSSAHRGLDVRIFHKECVSLVAAGFDTHLVINATPEDVARAATNGVTLHPLAPPSGRFSRMVMQAWHCYRISRRLDADIYHFHDPELIPYGMLLALSGKKVIYDVHEDVPNDILTKDWIPLWARKVVAGIVCVLEHTGARYFFSVITATPFIAARFRQVDPTALDINNYPLTDEFTPADNPSERKKQVCYIGGIERVRGIQELIQALALVRTDTRLNLCGRFNNVDLEADVKAQPGWGRVNEHGFVDRAGVRAVLERSMAGLVNLHPITNYLDALPVKMFEYMAAGIPAIASNFPLWREIIKGNDCGLCVDPLDPQAIADAIDYLVANPEEARRMGENGRRAVTEKYNWSIEEAKLIGLYKQVLSR
jgi:glycosyltransferase involved in cell wall biosynthesis